MIRGAAAAATSPAASEAARAILEAGGTAVDAIIAGFLGAAGEGPGVLLAPVVAIVAGTGAGARAFDGRAAQPGLGAQRPRGFVGDAPIPAGARAAAPRSIAMLILLHGHRGRTPLAQLARAGVLGAEHAGAKARSLLLRKVGAAGVLALRAPEIARAILAAGGPVAGGVLTERDLAEAIPAEADAAATAAGEGFIYRAPWPVPDVLGRAEAIVACDGRGILAALAYAPARALEGIAVPELEIALCADAVPVRRGVTRLAPGTPLPAPAPAAILGRKGFWSAVALGGASAIDPASLAELGGGLAIETALADLRARTGAAKAIAVATDGSTARSAVSEG